MMPVLFGRFRVPRQLSGARAECQHRAEGAPGGIWVSPGITPSASVRSPGRQPGEVPKLAQFCDENRRSRRSIFKRCWMLDRVKKTRQNKSLEPGSDSITTGQTLGPEVEIAL